MWVLCLITVAYMTNGRIEGKEVRLSGLVTSQTKKAYYVDFSKEAKENQYIGDYSDLLVSKDNCFEIIQSKKGK